MCAETWYEFVWLSTFDKSARKLLSEEDRRAIERELCENTEAGALIRGTGGFRKFRYALQGVGKSGGARIIYFPDDPCDRVYMILAYAKPDKATLTGEEKSELRTLARALKAEEC